MTLGNFPTGGAVTADGRFLWTVSAGFGNNDVRIVDTARTRVLPDHRPCPARRVASRWTRRHRLAYVSGLSASLAGSRRRPSLPGAAGNFVLVYSWSRPCGQARFVRVIPVPPQPGAPTVQVFPPPRDRLRTTTPGRRSWRSRPTARRLLVPLNLADSAAVIDLKHADQVRYVRWDRELPVRRGDPARRADRPGEQRGGRDAVGRSTCRRGVKLRDITVGPPLSHPAGHRRRPRRGAGLRRPLGPATRSSSSTCSTRRVERTISVGRSAGLGHDAGGARAQSRRARACSWPSRAPTRSPSSACRARRPPPRSTGRWSGASRRPTDPQVVLTAAAQGGRRGAAACTSPPGASASGPTRPARSRRPLRPDLLGLQPDPPRRPTSSAAAGPPTLPPWSRARRA